VLFSRTWAAVARLFYHPTQGAVNSLVDGAYPPGLAADMVVPLLSAAAGTYDIYVF